MEPRLGKSKAALDYCGILALKGEVQRVLVLAPRIALDVWESQLEQHFPYPYYAETFDEYWDGNWHTEYRGRWLQMGLSGKEKIEVPQFFLASREETFRRKSDGKKGYLRPKQRILEKWDPDVVILDESHEYKRPGGVGAQDAWRMVRRLRKRRSNGQPWVIELSGTPNPKGWIDFFAQFRIMDETIFGTSAADFEERHVVRHRKYAYRIVKYQRVKELERKVRENSIAVNAEEAGLANVQFFERLNVTLPPRAMRMYHELVEEFITEWEKGVISAANAGVKRLRLLQLCGGFTTDGEEIHGEKVAKAKAYLQLLHEQGESVVVYSRFTPEVSAVYDVLQDVGFRAFRVDGSTSRKDRRRATTALEKIPSTPTAISFQYQAGSRAIELVGAAETLYYSTPDGWVDYFQTVKRTQGPNQKRPVRYTHLVVPGTVDVSVVRSLQEKEDGHAELMNNPRRYLTGL